MRQTLWNRWQTEYLQELQKRKKWQIQGEPIELNTMVLMMEDNTPPLHWPLGRVVELHPGRDGKVRVVQVRTSTGIYKRAVRKLCQLPFTDEDEKENLKT